jgi:transposase
MHHLETAIDRGEISIIALEEMVHSDSYARLVDLFVDALPLSKLGFTYAQHESQGRLPYRLAVLLKLYRYGYRHGLRSSFMHHQQKRTIY